MIFGVCICDVLVPVPAIKHNREQTSFSHPTPPEIVEGVAREAKSQRRLNHRLSGAEQEKRAVCAVPGAKLLAGHHHRAILAIPNEHAGLLNYYSRVIIHRDRMLGWRESKRAGGFEGCLEED